MARIRPGGARWLTLLVPLAFGACSGNVSSSSASADEASEDENRELERDAGGSEPSDDDVRDDDDEPGPSDNPGPSDPDDDPDPEGPDPDGPGPDSPGPDTPSPDDDPSPNGPNPETPVDPCENTTAAPGAAVLRRLTPEQYRNTVAALFPSVPLPAIELAAGERVHGFDNLAEGQAISALWTEQAYQAATAIGITAAQNLDAWAPCTSDDAACAEQITRQLVPRAQRRPLAEQDVAAYLDLVETTRADEGIESAVELLVQVVLQTPEFLYLPEIGDASLPAPDGLTALDGFEIASRLSYFLWRSLPDDELWRAAEDGELTEASGIEAQVERLLSDDRARATLADLHAQWFQTWRIQNVQLSPTDFPEFGNELRDDLQASLSRYLEAVFFEDGTVEALFEGRFAYVNDRIAPLFGVAAPATGELVRVDLDPTERAGVLTQPGWLLHRSHETEHSPIYRGAFVLDHVLCSPTGAPPPGADVPLNLPADTSQMTGRQRWEQTHSAACAACHARIDGVGFLFEHYDALGRYRTTDNGQPVDASGEIFEAGDANGPVADALEFASQLSDSEHVHQCVTTHYYRYAMGRSEVAADACQVSELSARLTNSGGDLQALVNALVQSPAFRFRAPATPTEEM